MNRLNIYTFNSEKPLTKVEPKLSNGSRNGLILVTKDYYSYRAKSLEYNDEKCVLEDYRKGDIIKFDMENVRYIIDNNSGDIYYQM